MRKTLIIERAQGEGGKLAEQQLEASDRSPWSPFGLLGLKQEVNLGNSLGLMNLKKRGFWEPQALCHHLCDCAFVSFSCLTCNMEIIHCSLAQSEVFTNVMFSLLWAPHHQPLLGSDFTVMRSDHPTLSLIHSCKEL